MGTRLEVVLVKVLGGFAVTYIVDINFTLCFWKTPCLQAPEQHHSLTFVCMRRDSKLPCSWHVRPLRHSAWESFIAA
jgi:hypothetical protein